MAAYGPAMEVYGRYSQVVDLSGGPLPARPVPDPRAHRGKGRGRLKSTDPA